MLQIPEFQQRHIVQTILYGAVLIIWLTPEDSTLIIVSVLGSGLSFMTWRLAALKWLGGYILEAKTIFPAFVIFGAVVGFGAIWGTVGLMIFKNAWHAHAAPDFPNTVIIGITRRLIPWTMAGGLFGGGVGLWYLARNRERG